MALFFKPYDSMEDLGRLQPTLTMKHPKSGWLQHPNVVAP